MQAPPNVAKNRSPLKPAIQMFGVPNDEFSATQGILIHKE